MTKNLVITPGWRIDTTMDTIQAQLHDTLAQCGEKQRPAASTGYMLERLEEHVAPFTQIKTERDAHEQIEAVYAVPDDDLISDEVHDKTLLAVDDISEIPEDYTGLVIHVNERGNRTLHQCDNGILTEIWSIV